MAGIVEWRTAESLKELQGTAMACIPIVEPKSRPEVPASGEIEAGIDVPQLEGLLKDYLFSKSIGTLNPPRFGAVLGAKHLREKHLCVLYSVQCGPERPYEAAIGDEDETFEEVAYITDYFSVSDAPPHLRASLITVTVAKAQSPAATGTELQSVVPHGPGESAKSSLFCKASEHVLLPAAGLESETQCLRSGTKQFATWESQVQEVVFGQSATDGEPGLEFIGRFKGSAGQGSWERACEEARMLPTSPSARRLGLRRFPTARRRSESQEVFVHSEGLRPPVVCGVESEFQGMFKDMAGKPSWVLPLEGKRTVAREMEMPEAPLRLSPLRGQKPTKRTWLRQTEAMLRLSQGCPARTARLGGRRGPEASFWITSHDR